MLRSKFKDVIYFENFIEEQEKRIQKYEMATKGRELDIGSKKILNQTLFRFELEIFIANYSLGKPIGKLKKTFPKLLSRFLIGWTGIYDSFHLDEYIEFIWILSLAYLLDEENEVFENLKVLYDKSKINDLLIDYIFSQKLINKSKSKVYYGKIYTDLANIALDENTEDYTQVFSTFVNSLWYKKMKTTEWHDDHKSKENLHAGYWCFEAAAIAKIKGLDDSKLKNSKYYPYDLVHHKEPSNEEE